MQHHGLTLEFLRKGPPYRLAPQVCLPIASLLVDGISSNLAHIYISPGKIFLIWCHDISTNQRKSHDPKQDFACPDETLRSV